MKAKALLVILWASIAFVSQASAWTHGADEADRPPRGVAANRSESTWALQSPSVTGPQAPILHSPGTTALQEGGGGAGCGVSPTGMVKAPATITINSGTCAWEQWDFRGYFFRIRGSSNVTLRNDWFDAGAQTTQGQPGSLFSDYDYRGKLVIDHSDFDGGNGPTSASDAFVSGLTTLTYNRFRNGQLDLIDSGCWGGCEISHNYFLNWGLSQGNHADALTLNNAANTNVSDNLFAMTVSSQATRITASVDNGSGRPGNSLHVSAISGPNLSCCGKYVMVAIPGGRPSLVKIKSGSGGVGSTLTIDGPPQLISSRTMTASAVVTDALRLVPNVPIAAHGWQNRIDNVTINRNIIHNALPDWNVGDWGYAVAADPNGRLWATPSASWSGTKLTLNGDVGGTVFFASGLYAIARGLNGSPEITYTGPSSSFEGHFDSPVSLTLDSVPSAGFAVGQKLYGANVKGEPRIGANTSGSGCPAPGCAYAVTGTDQTAGASTAMISDALGLAGSTYALDIAQPSGSGPVRFGPLRNIVLKNNTVMPGLYGALICNGGVNSYQTLHPQTAAPLDECASP